ncbi:MAG: hypothetical protein WDW38_007526 [Sanguina aurantia]
MRLWASTLAASLMVLTGSSGSALAARPLPPIVEVEGRCEVSALDKFADTRKSFSQEAAGGGMTEALVDVRNCDFSNLNLSGKVMSGVQLQGANFKNAKLVGSQFARADARGANLAGADLSDTNAYSTNFNGANLEGAQFENSVLTMAMFGRDGPESPWANLKGAHFEGALISSSDVERICENPTLEEDTRKYELGCRKGR